MSTPSNIFKGKLGRKYFYQLSYLQQQQERREFNWAMNVKPGDLVNCCDYWNRSVESVEHTFGTVVIDKEFGLCVGEWVTDTKNLSDFVWLETTFHFTDGYQHSTSGGCAVPAWTADEVRCYHPNCDEKGCKK
jgi:hypothetical protein